MQTATLLMLPESNLQVELVEIISPPAHTHQLYISAVLQAHSCLPSPNPTCWEGSGSSPTSASSQFTASTVRPGCPRRSEPLQTAAVFETGPCNQQLTWQPGSLRKAKQHRLMLMRHNEREASNTRRATYVSQPWHLAVWMANLYQVQMSAAPAPVPDWLLAATPQAGLGPSALHCPSGSLPRQTRGACL